MRQPTKTIDQIETELEKKEVKKEKRDDPKELVIEKLSNGLHRVRFTAGGEVPDTLKGTWTSRVKAQQAIELHKSGRL